MIHAQKQSPSTVKGGWRTAASTGYLWTGEEMKGIGKLKKWCLKRGSPTLEILLLIISRI
jgi:hypothetical protein